MSDLGPFRTVLRGYDPTQVDHRLLQLTSELDDVRSQSAELGRQVQALERRLAERAGEDVAQQIRPDVVQPTYAGLGARVAQILTLTEEEAHDVAERAAAGAEALRRETEARASLVMADADRYDQAVRTAAQEQVDRLLTDAQQRADDVLDAADREAARRREEAAAVWEDARSRAAQAATDFELALAVRRHRTQAEDDERARESAEAVAAADRSVAEARGRADDVESEADAHRDALLAGARADAAQMLAEAREQAAGVREESQRELAAATAQRDSIHAQLANVRQMLATLSGGTAAPGSLPVTGLDVDDAAPDGDDGVDGDAPFDLDVDADGRRNGSGPHDAEEQPAEYDLLAPVRPVDRTGA